MTNIMNLVAIVLALAVVACAFGVLAATAKDHAERYFGNLPVVATGIVSVLPLAVFTLAFFNAMLTANNGPLYVAASLFGGGVVMIGIWLFAHLMVECTLEFLEDRGYIVPPTLKEIRKGADQQKKRWYKR